MSRASLPFIGAGILCAGAVFSFGAAFVGALSIEPLPQAPATAAEPAPPATATNDEGLTSDALMLAVDHDPFRPDRQRSPERYHLPGDEPPPPPAPPPQLPPPPPFRLIGTALTPTGGIAIIEIENTTRVIEVGESLLNYRLTSVEAERATMTGTEQEVQLPLVRAVANVNASATRGRGPQPPPGRNNAAQTAREMLDKIRESGGALTPQMLEMIQRLQAEGREVQIQTQGGGRGGVMIRTRPDTTDTSAPRAPLSP